MMRNPKANRMPQLKDNLQAYPEPVRNKYKFLTLLFTLVLQNRRIVSNDPAIVREVYHKNRGSFENQDGDALITEFF